VKKVSQARYPKRSKKAKEADVSLEAHASTVSPDDVSNSSLLSFHSYTSYSYTLLFSGFGEEIYHLGYGVRWVPKGCESFRRYNFDVQSPLVFCTFILCYLSNSLSTSYAAALATANARIALLEAELKASQKAYDVATAAKAIAEKSQKSALAKAKKVERALTDANKEHAQWE
jgi:hypothetical protein